MNPVHVAVEKNIKNVVENKMKLWISDSKMPTHRLVKLNCEEHSDFKYVGDLSDEDLEKLFLELDPKMDIQKNMKLIKYYGYLHLFIINRKY